MKKILFLGLMMAASISLTMADEVRLDSAFTNYYGGNWKLMDYYNYNAAGQNVSIVTWDWNSSDRTWFRDKKDTLIYNADGSLAGKVTSHWYDPDGGKVIRKAPQSDAARWEISSGEYYTYNTNGQLLYTLMGEYDNTTQTMNLTDSLFNTYNADGRLSDVKWYSLSGSALVYSNHSTYSYDDANRTVLIYDYRVSGAAEVLQYKIDQFFNTDGTIHEENFYSFDDPDWVPNGSNEYFYNEAGLLERLENSEWDSESEVYQGLYHTYYYYSAPTAINNILNHRGNSNKFFRNGQLYIQRGNELFNAQGARVK